MNDMCGVVHPVLERSIKVRECLGAAGKAHTLTQVVTANLTVVALFAHNASLNGNALTGDKILHTRADSSDHTRCFMAEDERCLKCKITISTL
jgi:hypothetical protein